MWCKTNLEFTYKGIKGGDSHLPPSIPGTGAGGFCSWSNTGLVGNVGAGLKEWFAGIRLFCTLLLLRKGLCDDNLRVKQQKTKKKYYNACKYYV